MMPRGILLILGFVWLAGKVHAAPAIKNRAAIVASQAFAWLAGQKQERVFEPDVIWIYDFLMRKYGFPELPQVAAFRADARNGRFDNSDFAPLIHVISAGAGSAPDLNSTTMHPIDRATYGALWCGKVEIPADYREHLDKLARHGEYALTHAYLALQILKEKDCTFFQANRKELLAMAAQQTKDMKALAEKSGKITDLEIETAAFLAFATHGSIPSETFLRRAVEFGEQRLTAGHVSRLRPHTVVLLLWFLMEYLRPEAPVTFLSGQVK